jgi:phosphoglycerate transporter family protein
MANALFRIFAPAPAVPVTPIDPAEIKARYRYWQRRILIGSIVGYALFYFVRKNLSVAMPAMSEDLGISKRDLGLFLTLHGVLYGISKFFHGFVGDRANARTFMATGLLLSAVVNIFFGFSSAIMAFGIFWMLNGWVQGMGYPPCARLMTHWFPPSKLATKMSLWNISHSVGAGLVVVLCGYLVHGIVTLKVPFTEWSHSFHFTPDWRLCFFVPATLAIIGSVYLLFTLRDTPPSLGLPEVEGTAQPESGAGGKHSSFLMRQVFSNPVIWLVAVANFFVYIVRYAVLDWGPTFLSEAKGIKIHHAGWMIAASEISGIVGTLLSGWLTDKVFGGRGARMCVIFMIGAGCSMLAFWKLAGDSAQLSAVLLCFSGFFIYGPQALVGTIAANLATKRAAATAVGLTGIFGYASTIVSGWGVGALVDAYGWNAGFAGLIASAVVGAGLFACAWRAKAHGYLETVAKH